MSRRLNGSCAIADHRSALAGRDQNRTGQDWTERCPTANGVVWNRIFGIAGWVGIGLLWSGAWTDLLDNGLTESLTHGARDFFLGRCR